MSFTDILTHGLISQNGSTATYVVGMLVTIVVSYLIGSLNFAVIFSMARGDDIRLHGSGNAGATNAIRTYGRGVGIAVFICDFVKSVLCVFIGMLLMPADGFAYVAALFCMVGHSFPLYFGFRGGKGVAVLTGAMLTLNPIAGAFSIVLFALVLLLSKYVSLGSIVMSLAFPIINRFLPFSLFSRPEVMDQRSMINYILSILVPMLMAVLVCIMHISNIKRIYNGTENRFGEKKK